MNPPETSRHLPMQTWLDVLRTLLPARGVLVVGAGMGNGPWVQWLKDRRLSPVHLVEGDEQQYQHLTRSLPRIDGWTSWRDVVAASTDPIVFSRANNPAESGLLAPERLREFWPHLDTEHSAAADPVVTLDSLGAETELAAVNWLILDCLPASDLLRGGMNLLTRIDVALIRVVLGKGDGLETARQDAVDGVLRTAGLTCRHVQPERHPGLAHVLYMRDMEYQADVVQKRLQQANDLLKLENLSLIEQSQELERAKVTLEQEKLALEDRLLEFEFKKFPSEKERQIFSDKLENSEKPDTEDTNKFNEIASAVKIQNAQIEKIEKNLTQQIDSGLKNLIKQIESFISIESYLIHSNSPLPMHGWPVSADFALRLIEMIKVQNYDLIIEFGSGTSTALMAKVLSKIDTRHHQSIEFSVKSLVAQESINLNKTEDNLPIEIIENLKTIPDGKQPFIISFDHHEKFYNETLMRLQHERLTKFVELIYSPLCNYTDLNGNHYLYYSCKERFTTLKESLKERQARILVVVDGPPGSTNRHARYPALPIMIQHLASHRLDFFMDDYNRKEEKEIIDLWTELLDKRSLTYKKEIFAFEKGACLLSIG